jgi:ABC-type nickel/cobalt efflux system permease component RcnA
MSDIQTFIITFNTLMVCNYAWQVITGQARGTAAERNFLQAIAFQAIALFAAWMATRGGA